MTKVIWDLAKALINATLLLAALCLFLGWQFFSSIEAVSQRFSDLRGSLTPVHQDIRALKADLGELKTAIVAAPSGPERLQLAETLAALDKRMAKMDRNLTSRLEGIEHIAISAAEAFAARLARGMAETLGSPAQPKT